MKLNHNYKPSLVTMNIVLAVAGLVAAYLVVYLRGNPYYPLNTIFFDPGHSASDFFNNTQIPDFRYREFWTLPPAALVVCWFQKILLNATVPNLALVIFSGSWMMVLVIFVRNLLARAEQSRPGLNALALIITSYPVLFCLDRGHFAAFVVTAIVAGAADILYGRGFAAKYFFAAAAAVKITPIIFILLMIQRRLFKQAGLTILITALLTAVSTLMIQTSLLPSYGLGTWLEGLAEYDRHYASGLAGMDMGSTIWGAVHGIILLLSPRDSMTVDNGLLAVKGIAALAGLSLLALAVRRNYDPLRLFSLLVVYFLIAAPVMADYYLIVLLPLVALIMTNKRLRPLTFILTGVMIPKPFFLLAEEAPVRLSVIVNPILLVIFATLVVVTKSPEPAQMELPIEP